MAVAASFSDESSLTSCMSSLYSLEPEEVFINDLLSDKSDSPSHLVCRVCDEGHAVTSRCRDCNESLCDHCVRMHLRMRITKDHFIQRFDDNSNMMVDSFQKQINNLSPPGNNILCDFHITEVVRLYCESCNVGICNECVSKEHNGHVFVYIQDAVETARKMSVKLLLDIGESARMTKENLDTANRMIETVDHKATLVSREIRNVMRRIHLAVEERERELLNRVERIRHIKGKVLSQQVEEFRLALSRYSLTHDLLKDALEGGSSHDLLQAKNQAVNEIKLFKQLKLALQPYEDDVISFYHPDQAFFNSLATVGNVTSSGITSSSMTEGMMCPPPFGKDMGLLSSTSTMPPLFEHSLNGHDNMLVPFNAPDVPFPLADVDNRRDGVFGGAPFRSKIDNAQRLQVMLRGKQLQGSPFNINAFGGRNYTEAGPVKATFGKEGDGEGELCRPWGVCCDRSNNIIVADRSNNRVQIFSPCGVFIRRFGHHGSEAGMFDRPAGVATDPSNRIVVADKDNHRIQVFTSDGEFVHMFGEKGNKNGQFNYPWDVDVDKSGRIVVSDTRNHRIQLFTPDGTFINKYGYENTSTMWKHFDSPRGVCFGLGGNVIITDFNNHRLVVIDANFRTARFLGSEGSGTKEFLRPQGVAVDRDGHIIVADSRNHRIQVFEANGSFLWQFGESGKEPGQLDRPSGVCLTNDGQIVVVDFGNNRIQVF